MKDKLTWDDLFEFCERDKAGRWYPNDGTPAAEYINENSYRSPSRAYPYSYAKPLLTKKFYKWAKENYPQWLEQF